MGTSTRLLVALAIVLAACSPSSGDDTTPTNVLDSTTTTAESATEAAAPTTTAPSVETTTTAQALDANAAVEAKTAAVLGALPDDWTGEQVPAVTDAQNEDFAYDPCLLPDDFDIDNLDDYTSAALVAEFMAPIDPASPFGAAK